MINFKFLKKLFKYVLLGSLIGALTGVFCAMLLKSLDLATQIRINNEWLLFLLPAGGGIISYIYFKYGKNSSKGNNLIIEEINDAKSNVPFRMAPLVFLGTFTTHLFGGSAGREGSGVQMGGAIADTISKRFNVSKHERKMLLLSGISSGFGAIFGTPLAGTIFALEISLLGKMNYEALVPCFFASFIGNITVNLIGVKHSHYDVKEVLNLSGINIVKVITLAIIFGVISVTFIKLTHYIKNLFNKKFKNVFMKTFIGGCIIILLTYIVGTNKYLGLSLPLLTDSFKLEVSYYDFILKLIFTAVTLGAGYQGGEVTPLFVIGATAGCFFGILLGVPTAFAAALGLIGVFAGATNTPIASFVLGVELFGANFIQYMFLTCLISYVFSGHSCIYTSQKVGISKYFDDIN